MCLLSLECCTKLPDGLVGEDTGVMFELFMVAAAMSVDESGLAGTATLGSDLTGTPTLESGLTGTPTLESGLTGAPPRAEVSGTWW